MGTLVDLNALRGIQTKCEACEPNKLSVALHSSFLKRASQFTFESSGCSITLKGNLQYIDHQKGQYRYVFMTTDDNNYLYNFKIFIEFSPNYGISYSLNPKSIYVNNNNAISIPTLYWVNKNFLGTLKPRSYTIIPDPSLQKLVIELNKNMDMKGI